jgi:hypothetical protein
MVDRSQPDIADIAAGVILALAGLLSAWATFQASLWGGAQAAAFAEANRLQTEASRLEIVATQRQATALAVAHAWLNATISGDRARAEFYERHLQPQQRRLFEEWRAQLPDDIAAAKASGGRSQMPLPDVLSGGREAAAGARAEADAAFRDGERANMIGDKFTFATVLLSLVLFLAGTGQLLRLRQARTLVIALAGLLMLGAAGYALTIPRAAYTLG